MERVGITTILCGAILMGIPLVGAEPDPPPTPYDLDAELLDSGAILLSWKSDTTGLSFRVVRNSEVLGTVFDREFVDPDPLPAASYQVIAVSGDAESDPSAPILIASTGADADWETINFRSARMNAEHSIKADFFTSRFPPDCTLVLVNVYTYPPFIGAHVNQRCLDAWLDP